MNTEEIRTLNALLNRIADSLQEMNEWFQETDKSLKQISKEIKNKKIDSGVI